jgi:type II secretory pathway component GspD/PulD (secretin)
MKFAFAPSNPRKIGSLLLLTASLAAQGLAQDLPVKLRAKGEDVRLVVATIFEQLGQNYVYEARTPRSLYVNLDEVPLKQALSTVSILADIRFERRGETWHVLPTNGKSPAISGSTSAQPFKQPNSPSKTQPAKTQPGKTQPTKTAPTKVDPATGKRKPDIVFSPGAPVATKSGPISRGRSAAITGELLNTKVISLKFTKIGLQYAFSEIGQRSGVNIVCSPSLPNYSIDISVKNQKASKVLNDLLAATKLTKTILPNGDVQIGVR